MATEQERLELQLEQDARLLVDAINRIATDTDAYEQKFGPLPTDGSRMNDITYSAIHIRNFVENNGNAAAGDHWKNLLGGMYVI